MKTASKSNRQPEEVLIAMKTTTRLIALAVFLSGTFFVSSALACSTDAWNGGATAGTLADEPTNGVPRVSGICGLEVTGTGYVVDNNPAGESTFIGRFYVFPKLLPAGNHELFSAYSDEAGTKLFEITYDGALFKIDATNAGGDSVTATANTTRWNLIEFSWTSDGAGELWVNADANSDLATASFAPGTGAVEQVRLGAVGGIGGDTAYFDDYESHRSLPVGALLAGDAKSDETINIFDIVFMRNEILANGLASGQPDCTLDGKVNIFDIVCARNIILGN